MKIVPIPGNEVQRLKALKDYNILDTFNEEEFDRLTQLAALICGVPIALVSLIDETRQWFKANVGLQETKETPRHISFCQFTIMGSETLEIVDATKDERFAENPLVTGSPEIRFYAGYPLTDPNGMNLGSLCVIDRVPKKLDDTQLKALEILGKEVVSQIVARKIYSERVKLEKLFNYSKDLICIIEKNGYLKKVNPRFENVMGYSKEELLSMSFLDIVYEDDKSKTLLELEKISTEETTLNFQNRLIKKEGITLIFNWIGNRDIETEEIYAIGRDVTEKVKILEELNAAKQIAEKSVRVKDQFLSNMSHEIRTPLNAIIGFNDLLKQSLLNQEQEKYVDIITIASQNLMVILNDILDVSKLESGLLVLENQPIHIKEIIENVINLQSQKAKNKGLKLLLSIDQDIPLNVIGDSTRISQVLINFIDNAIKFTTEGYVELKVIELARENNISLLRFNIKDTGIGIDKEKQKMIFDRFSQAESSTTRIFGGTGLGLNIAKMIVEMYGGKIELQSELGKGAEFYFEISLPISNSIEVSSTLETKTVNSNASLAGKSILVVEDNELNQLLASSYLKKNGAIVDLADNGVIALEKVKQKNYDIILMDLQMPVMDGYTATKIIRQELKSELPIVACSAHSSTVENDNCIKKGMNGYISKPYSENTLIGVLSSIFLEKSNTKNELIDSKITINLDQDDFNKILGDIAIEHGKEFVEMMLEVYLRRIPQDIIEMEQALKNQDREVIRSKAHLLIGSLSSLNFELGTKLAKNVENSVLSKDFETINLETISLIDYLNKSIKEIKQ